MDTRSSPGSIPGSTRGAPDAERRRTLALLGRLIVGGSVGTIFRGSLRAVLGAGVAEHAAARLATGVSAAAPPAEPSSTGPAVLASGPGPAVGGGTLLRGCSAIATAVERFGGRLPAGLSIDFGRRTALLVTGLHPVGLVLDEAAGEVRGTMAPAWTLVAVHGRAHDLGRTWRVVAAGRTITVGSETTGG